MKTSELIGPALDWAVAKCEGMTADMLYNFDENGWIYGGGRRCSTDWSQGGPIIERMFRDGLKMQQGERTAGNQRAWAQMRDGKYYWHESSPLIAAMRCYVASKLGDEIKIPEELLR